MAHPCGWQISPWPARKLLQLKEAKKKTTEDPKVEGSRSCQRSVAPRASVQSERADDP